MAGFASASDGFFEVVLRIEQIEDPTEAAAHLESVNESANK